MDKRFFILVFISFFIFIGGCSNGKTTVTKEKMYNEILNESNLRSTASYIREVSYNKSWLTGNVVGWIAMKYNNTNCAIWTPQGTQNLFNNLTSIVNFSNYDRWIVVIPLLHKNNPGGVI